MCHEPKLIGSDIGYLPKRWSVEREYQTWEKKKKKKKRSSLADEVLCVH
jgi:hypothetical protein